MYTYICICAYVCTYIRMSVYVCTCVYVYTCTRTCVYVCEGESHVVFLTVKGSFERVARERTRRHPQTRGWGRRRFSRYFTNYSSAPVPLSGVVLPYLRRRSDPVVDLFLVFRHLCPFVIPSARDPEVFLARRPCLESRANRAPADSPAVWPPTRPEPTLPAEPGTDRAGRVSTGPPDRRRVICCVFLFNFYTDLDHPSSLSTRPQWPSGQRKEPVTGETLLPGLETTPPR